MSARVDVKSNTVGRGVDILVSPLPGRILAWEVTNKPYDEAVMASQDETLNLPDDVARALYEALHRHYGGTPDAAFLKERLDIETNRTSVLLQLLVNQQQAMVSGGVAQ